MVQAGHVQAEGEAQDWKRTTRGDTTLLMSENNNSILNKSIAGRRGGESRRNDKPPGGYCGFRNTSLSVKKRQGMYRNRLKAVLLRHWLQDLFGLAFASASAFCLSLGFSLGLGHIIRPSCAKQKEDRSCRRRTSPRDRTFGTMARHR